MIRYSNLQEHLPLAKWDAGLFDRNMEEIRRLESKLYINSPRDTVPTDGDYTPANSGIDVESVYATRHGEWGYIRVKAKANKSFSIGANSGAAHINLVRLNNSWYHSESLSPLSSMEGRYARGTIDTQGIVALRNVANNITAGHVFAVGGWYRLRNIENRTPGPYAKQPTAFSLDVYKRNMDEVDDRLSKSGGGNKIYDTAPVGTAGLINPTSLIQLSAQESSIFRFGSVCQILLVGKLTKALKTNSAGVFPSDSIIYNYTPRLVPKHSVGIPSGGFGDSTAPDSANGVATPVTAYMNSAGISLASATRSNYEYPKGMHIQLSTTFLLKDVT